MTQNYSGWWKPKVIVKRSKGISSNSDRAKAKWQMWVRVTLKKSLDAHWWGQRCLWLSRKENLRCGGQINEGFDPVYGQTNSILENHLEKEWMYSCQYHNGLILDGLAIFGILYTVLVATSQKRCLWKWKRYRQPKWSRGLEYFPTFLSKKGQNIWGFSHLKQRQQRHHSRIHVTSE